MIRPTIPEYENERLKNLHSYSILDTLPEEDYDNLTQIASEICETPISLVSLIDDSRQWFKSHHGLEATETPKEYAFCAHAINQPNDLFIIQDARKDERFHDNPLVTNDPLVIFYAGIPLVSQEGYALGTLCVIDHKPHHINERQKRSLIALSKQVVNILTLRKQTRLLQEKNDSLNEFAHIAAHDLKSPLIGILGLIKLFRETYSEAVGDEGAQWLEMINESATRLKLFIEGLLEYATCGKFLSDLIEKIECRAVQDEIIYFLRSDDRVQITFETDLEYIFSYKVLIQQVLMNLVSNGVKYNEKDVAKVIVTITENRDHYMFYVKDNGKGVDKNKLDKIFELFFVNESQDRFGNKGSGIGLATVRKMLESVGGSISVQSEIGIGSEFKFIIPK